MSCGIGHEAARCIAVAVGRQAAVAQIEPLSLERPYAPGPQKAKKKKNHGFPGRIFSNYTVLPITMNKEF